MLKKEKEFRSLCLKLGFTLLLQFILAYFLLWRADDVAALFGYKLNAVGRSILNSALYLICFMLPVLFFRLISQRQVHPGMGLSVKTDKSVFLMIPAAIGLIFGAAYLNSLLFFRVDFSKVYVETVIDSSAALVLEFIANAIVPAVCEEFLFRGCIESELIPYGKQNAVFFSALMFAVMHGNFAQFLYTFCAGLIIGYVFAETGSIWPGMLIHLFNNFFSVIEKALTMNSSNYFSDLLLTLLELVMIIAGVICLIVLIFKKELRPCNNDGCDTSGFLHSPARRFFNPCTICFIVLNGLEAVYLLIYAIMVGFYYG